MEQCLLSLMGELPYERINVQALCRRADISRTAFYRYFQNKDACLQSLLDRTLYDGAVFLASRSAGDDARAFREVLRFWRSQGALLDALVANGLTDRLVLQLVRHVQQEEPAILALLSTAHVDCGEEVLVFTFSGLLAMIVYWHQSGYRLSEEQMIDRLRRLMLQPLVTV